MMASGVPILIIPDGSATKLVGGKVLVAWNGSREARRAIADAMPILSTAQSVTVLVIDSAKTPQKFGEDPGVDIAAHLARHGVPVELEQIESAGMPVANVIGNRAVERCADLIVIGAYSHARSAEKIFGGVTRTLLSQMPVSVLVSR
jgi:nucleotide-binding universal stress UspA family protein